jgi:PAS domain S-box-containing protein
MTPRIQLEHETRLLIQAERICRMGAWEYRLETGMVLWTPELCRLLGYRRPQSLRTLRHSYRLYTVTSRAIVRDAFHAAIHDGTPYDLELEMRTIDGRLLWVREVCRVTLQRGRVTSVIGITQDITEQRQMAPAGQGHGCGARAHRRGPA